MASWKLISLHIRTTSVFATLAKQTTGEAWEIQSLLFYLPLLVNVKPTGQRDWMCNIQKVRLAVYGVLHQTWPLLNLSPSVMSLKTTTKNSSLNWNETLEVEMKNQEKKSVNQWILWKMRHWNCQFCEKKNDTYFENVNLWKNS